MKYALLFIVGIKTKQKIDIEKEKRQFITVFSFKAVNNVDSGNVTLCILIMFSQLIKVNFSLISYKKEPRYCL